MKRGFGLAFGAILGIAVVVLALSLINDDTEKGQPTAVDAGTVLGKLKAEAKLVSSSRTYRTKVQFKDECSLPNPFGDDPVLPGMICGTDSKFEVDGQVTFSIDLSSISPDAVDVREGAVTVHLPPPVPNPPTIDKVDPMSSDRGILDRLRSALSEDKTLYDKVVQEGRKQISATAAGDTEALDLASTEAESTLESLLRASGVASVVVEFDGAPGSESQ